jgi:5-hydroxyisourate hydrolase/2-oxo-4-hydroxy-4-carboxy-5-ureidoimidazoline decarboxylase
MMTLEELNSNTAIEVAMHLEKCCVSKTWISEMAASRPFTSSSDLIEKAATIWNTKCTAEDYKEAFSGHPKIGDVTSLKQKFSNTKDWANNEQSKVDDADDKTLHDLAKGNDAYLEKFGYIFIVSASGKSAKEMLTILQKRLLNSEEEELQIAMNEQHKITVIRLKKLIAEVDEDQTLKSQITTHALDTAKGVPAKAMPVVLRMIDGNTKKLLSVGLTNTDGRVADLLPPGRMLAVGTYEMEFDTKFYHKAQNQTVFYPDATIKFIVTDAGHYHIPLLISPFGYSTYKGS